MPRPKINTAKLGRLAARANNVMFPAVAAISTINTLRNPEFSTGEKVKEIAKDPFNIGLAAQGVGKVLSKAPNPYARGAGALLQVAAPGLFAVGMAQGAKAETDYTTESINSKKLENEIRTGLRDYNADEVAEQVSDEAANKYLTKRYKAKTVRGMRNIQGKSALGYDYSAFNPKTYPMTTKDDYLDMMTMQEAEDRISRRHSRD